MKKSIIGNLIEIHIKNKNSFEVGRVIFENSNYLIVKEFDSNGEYDGYLYNERKEIIRIKHSSKYLDFINFILKDDSSYLSVKTKQDIFLYAIENHKLLMVTCSSWNYYKIIKPYELQNDRLFYHIIEDYQERQEIKNTLIMDFYHIELDTIETRTMEKFLNINGESLKYSSELCEIYVNDFYDGFDVGVIKAEDTSHIIIESYNSYGQYNGYLFQRKKQITKIISNTKYLKYLNTILQPYNSSFRFEDLTGMLQYAFENNRIVSMLYERCKYYYNIKINDFDGCILTYQIISVDGKLQEQKSINISKINYLIIDSLELKQYEFFINKQQ